MGIEKIYFINLDDKIHRWKKFENVDERIHRFQAIDSRDDYRVCHEYGLKLDPVGLANKLYFSQTTGAVGAYLSHYLIWKDILKRKIKCALVLEDDALYSDVKEYLRKKLTLTNGYDFYQLNKRYHDKNYFNNFDGLESYIITNSGANLLVKATQFHGHFNDVIRFVPDNRFHEAKLNDYAVFKRERKQNWSIPNSITSAVDKFVGFNAHPNLAPSNRLNIKFENSIGLHKTDIKSDIMTSQFRPWAQCSENEIINLMSSDLYEYWKRGKYFSPKYIS